MRPRTRHKLRLASSDFPATAERGVLPRFMLTAFAIVSAGLYGCESSIDGPSLTKSDLSSPAKSKPFELTALKIEEHLGALKRGESAAAVFPIRNFGTMPAQLELGTPTCSCSLIDLDKPTLPPGETASIRMSAANRGKFGPFKASVTVSAASEPWSELLTVKAFGCGFKILSPTIRVTDAALDKPIVIVGRLFTARSSTGLGVDVRVLGTGSNRRANPLKIAPPRLSEPQASEEGFEREVEITLPSLTTLVGSPRDFHDTLVLHLSITFDGMKQDETVLVKRAS
jgi:Protein of unknown function (DUF1573)